MHPRCAAVQRGDEKKRRKNAAPRRSAKMVTFHDYPFRNRLIVKSDRFGKIVVANRVVD